MTRIAIALLAAAAGLAFPRVSNAQQQPQQNTVVLGAQAWARNCTRCHNARASSERTDRQWETIIAHMRARGNLTRTEAVNIAEYLKATNMPEAVVVSSGAPVPQPPEGRTKPDSTAQPPARNLDPQRDRARRSGGG